jgi:hypothetical protein
MLEWTICNNCGKILDNSQTACPSCGSEVEKVGMDYLRDYLNNFRFLVNTVNVFYDFSPSMERMEKSNLVSVVLDDLFKWFSYLGLGDDVITDNEKNLSELHLSVLIKCWKCRKTIKLNNIDYLVQASHAYIKIG